MKKYAEKGTGRVVEVISENATIMSMYGKPKACVIYKYESLILVRSKKEFNQLYDEK